MLSLLPHGLGTRLKFPMMSLPLFNLKVNMVCVHYDLLFGQEKACSVMKWENGYDTHMQHSLVKFHVKDQLNFFHRAGPCPTRPMHG